MGLRKNSIPEFESGSHLHVLQLATGQVHWTAVQRA